MPLEMTSDADILRAARMKQGLSFQKNETDKSQSSD
jgi:hypothetical protein